jgi:hypothetical protein
MSPPRRRPGCVRRAFATRNVQRPLVTMWTRSHPDAPILLSRHTRDVTVWLGATRAGRAERRPERSLGERRARQTACSRSRVGRDGRCCPAAATAGRAEHSGQRGWLEPENGADDCRASHPGGRPARRLHVSEPNDSCRLYRSTDGGWHWRSIDFADLRERGCGDPQVDFGRTGIAYFSVLTFRRDATGRKRCVIHVYRSDDDGATWSAPAAVGYGDQPDHDQLAIFSSDGRPDGVYITVLASHRVWLYRPTMRVARFCRRSW